MVNFSKESKEVLLRRVIHLTAVRKRMMLEITGYRRKLDQIEYYVRSSGSLEHKVAIIKDILSNHRNGKASVKCSNTI